MSAKLTFADVYQNELNPAKLNFGFLNVGLSISNGAPSADADIGTLYIDSNSGYLYRKAVVGAGAANWNAISYGNSSVSNTIYTNRVRPVTITSFTNGGNFLAGDLVGIYGVGAWSIITSANVTRGFPAMLGYANSALMTGGINQANTKGVTSTESFNGSIWTSGASLNVTRSEHGSCGGINAGLLTGGTITASSTFLSSTEFFNGSVWTNGSAFMNEYFYDHCCVGEQMAALVAGGNGTASTISELFNGSSWNSSGNINSSRNCLASFGSANAAVIVGGKSGAVPASTNLTSTELFNGTAWCLSGSTGIITGSATGAGAGSQNAGIANHGGPGIFNGSVWTSIAAEGGAWLQDGRIAGGTAFGVVAGGYPYSNSKDTYTRTETTHKKIYARYIQGAKKIGVYNGTNIITQGNVSFTYPANKYLVINRSAICSITNETTLTSITFSSVSGTAPVMTYNFSGTMNTLCIANGNIAIITSTGANPCSSQNAGTFVIVRQVNPTSIEISNASGIAENPGTGTMSIISSMMAVDNIVPSDIVIGKTDSTGNLFIPKPLQVGSMSQRLK
jgi:hypothetical protein